MAICSIRSTPHSDAAGTTPPGTASAARAVHPIGTGPALADLQPSPWDYSPDTTIALVSDPLMRLPGRRVRDGLLSTGSPPLTATAVRVTGAHPAVHQHASHSSRGRSNSIRA
jgi:hypothetical protein